MLSAENIRKFPFERASTRACWWTSPATRCPRGRRAGSGAGSRQRRLPPAAPGTPPRLRHRPHRRPPARPSANRSCQRHCPIRPLGVPTLAASGCRCRSRRNPVAVDSPGSIPWRYVLMSRLPGVRLDTVWDQLCSADRDRLAGQLGETIAALHQLPSPVIRDWWPADWPAFTAGQRARCVSEQRTLSVPALWAHQIPRFLEGVAVPAAGAAAHRGHARAPAGRRSPEGAGGCPG
jgi:Phosphotransferase enzyme family